MIPTPITDAAILTKPDVLQHFVCEVVEAETCRKLERQTVLLQEALTKHQTLLSKVEVFLEQLINE